MTALVDTHPTMLDVLNRLDPDGKVAAVAEVLQASNPMFKDAPSKEGNLPTGHKAIIRTGYATPTWRKLYGGVQPTKTRTRPITDACAMLEDYSEIDVAAADMNGNSAAWIASERIGKIESLGNEAGSTLWLGNDTTAPEEFLGFAPRFNSLSAENGEQILVSGSGDTDAVSFLIVVWGPDVHLITPKGMPGGLKVTDKGQVTIENVDGSGGRMEALREHYALKIGLHIRDWRQVARVQFDPDDVVASAATGPDLPALLGQALGRIHNLSAGIPVIYGGRAAKEALELQLNARGTLGLHTIKDAHGEACEAFRNIPLRQCDFMTESETTIT